MNCREDVSVKYYEMNQMVNKNCNQDIIQDLKIETLTNSMEQSPP
jgi:hypothetical protein